MGFAVPCEAALHTPGRARRTFERMSWIHHQLWPPAQKGVEAGGERRWNTGMHSLYPCLSKVKEKSFIQAQVGHMAAEA